MKTRTSILTYVITLVVGIILLIFNQETNLFKWIVVAIGILFMIPSVVALVTLLIPSRKGEEGGSSAKWGLLFASLGGLVFGILLVSMPTFFVSYLIYTFGVILILCGIMQIVFMSLTARPYGLIASYLIVPILTIIGGVVVIILGPEKIEKIVTILTGVILVVYSINGFVSAWAQRRRIQRIVADHRRNFEREEEAKAAKEQEAVEAEQKQIEASEAEPAESAKEDEKTEEKSGE